MTYVFIIPFLVLLMLNRMIFKSMIAPATLFVGIWTATITALALCGDLFRPLSTETLLIYLLGACVFCFGGMLAATVANQAISRSLVVLSSDRHYYCRVVLDFLFVGCLFALPLFAHKVLGPVGGWSSSTALFEVRRNAVASSGQTTTFDIVNNLSVLSRFVAFGMFYENDGTKQRKWRAYLSLLPAVAYGSLSGSKEPVVVILLTVMFLTWLKAKSVNIKTAIFVVVLCIGSFSAGILVINFAYARFSNTQDIGSRLAWVVASYWLGGPVAFDRVVQDPDSIPSTQTIDRFFLQTANSLGANFEVPSLHARYTPISDSNISSDTNVYTIYFSYYKDYGWLGMVLLMLCVSFCVTVLYMLSLRGGPVSVVLCAQILVGTIFSIYSENYFLCLNEYLKALLFFAALYYGPMISLSRQKRSTLTVYTGPV